MNDFRINVRVTNANIQRSIEGMGYASMPKWCEAFNYPYGTLNAYVALKLSPLGVNGDPKPSAMKLCELLGESFGEMFSEHQLDALPTNRASVEVSFEQIASLLESDGSELLEAVYETQKRAIVRKTLETLPPRTAEVLQRRFGLDARDDGLTLSAVGEQMGITTERVRQLECVALRKLREPRRAENLLTLVDSQP